MSPSAGRPAPHARRLLLETRAALLRARRAQRRRNAERTPSGRLMTAVVCVVAGLLVMVSAHNARGMDLRPGRNTDLVSLVQAQSRRNAELARSVTELRAEVDELSGQQVDETELSRTIQTRAMEAGFRAVRGPALSVTLSDAPASVAADGVDPDLLVVHQQDIQAVVNVLWAGGAEAMTIQGQRVISTTGIKCVGNTVVLHGTPYAPPYVIAAIGDPARLRAALASSETIRIYQQYVDAFGLGYLVRDLGRTTFPAHEGALDLSQARAGVDPPVATSGGPR